MIEIRDALIPEELPVVRELFLEYGESLGFDLCFQGFTDELATLPGRYAGPAGGIWLAHDGEATVGCIALRPLPTDTTGQVAEIKRLYVRTTARGTGTGRRLAERALAAAREHGWDRVVLDTLATMTAAMALYRSLGFRETEPYYENPLPGVVYFACELAREHGSTGEPR